MLFLVGESVQNCLGNLEARQCKFDGVNTATDLTYWIVCRGCLWPTTAPLGFSISGALHFLFTLGGVTWVVAVGEGQIAGGACMQCKTLLMSCTALSHSVSIEAFPHHTRDISMTTISSFPHFCILVQSINTLGSSNPSLTYLCQAVGCSWLHPLCHLMMNFGRLMISMSSSLQSPSDYWFTSCRRTWFSVRKAPSSFYNW